MVSVLERCLCRIRDTTKQPAKTKNINPALERVVNHCLEKNPEERFNSARDLAFALEAVSGPSTTASDTATILTRLPAAKGNRRGDQNANDELLHLQ